MAPDDVSFSRAIGACGNDEWEQTMSLPSSMTPLTKKAACFFWSATPLATGGDAAGNAVHYMDATDLFHYTGFDASRHSGDVLPYTDFLNAVNCAGGASPCDDHDHSLRMVALIQSAWRVAQYI